jgi:hypothetical protein
METLWILRTEINLCEPQQTIRVKRKFIKCDSDWISTDGTREVISLDNLDVCINADPDIEYLESGKWIIKQAKLFETEEINESDAFYLFKQTELNVWDEIIKNNNKRIENLQKEKERLQWLDFYYYQEMKKVCGD